jgi:hypothetical protein
VCRLPIWDEYRPFFSYQSTNNPVGINLGSSVQYRRSVALPFCPDALLG